VQNTFTLFRLCITLLSPLLLYFCICAFNTTSSSAPAKILFDRTIIESLPDGTYNITNVLKVEVRTPAAAENYRKFGVYFDDFSEVLELTATVKGSKDKKAQKIKQKRIYDRDYNDQMSVATDGKVRELKLEMPNGYPAVMEFRSLKRLNQAIALPLKYWIPRKNAPIAVGELILKNTSGNIRFKVIDPDSLIQISTVGTTTRMQVKNLTYDADRYKNAGILEKGPAVCLAPSQAAMEGISGNFDSWAGIGHWVENLVLARENMPSKAIKEVQALVSGVEDRDTKIAMVYNYVQQRSHYVSIQLGIGGFQPMSPTEVHATGYGDCKALSNYTRLLLKAVDIPSRYCVIGVNEREILFENFPSLNQANHVMLAVPMEKDTLWLECTSQHTPAGYIGDQASGRKALLLDGDNTQLVRTSAAYPDDNLVRRSSEITINANGGAEIKQSSKLLGNALSYAIGLQSSETSKQMRIIRSQYSVSLEDISIDLKIPALTIKPVAELSILAQIPTLTKRIDDKLILTVFNLFKQDEELFELSNAEDLFFYPRAIRHSDTIRYNAPEGYQFQAQKIEKAFASSFGNYDLSILSTPRCLTVIRTLSVKKSKLEGKALEEAKTFVKKLLRADRLSFSISPV